MSNAFKWDDILGGKKSNTPAEDSAEETTPNLTEVAGSAAPLTGEEDGAAANDELRNILQQLKQREPHAGTPSAETEAPAATFEEVVPQGTSDGLAWDDAPATEPEAIAPKLPTVNPFVVAEPEMSPEDAVKAFDAPMEVTAEAPTETVTDTFNDASTEVVSDTFTESPTAEAPTEFETPAPTAEFETPTEIEAPALTADAPAEEEITFESAAAEAEITFEAPAETAFEAVTEPAPEAAATESDEKAAKLKRIFGGKGSPVEEEKPPVDESDWNNPEFGHQAPFDPAILSMKLESETSALQQKVPARQLGNITEGASGFKPTQDVHIDEILTLAVERKASDIHLTHGLPPMARIDGEIIPLPYQPLHAEDTRRLIYDVLNDERLEKFERTHELDFAYSVRDVGRFRFNVYMQRGSVGGAMRAIPTKIPDFETLGLPKVIKELSKRTSGLVLVTGPTGSGKSTTIATMIDDINNHRRSHIMTIEDPIEYLHTHKQCMVNQREMHSDTFSFHNSLRAVLREDPDIILVGELRDLETIEAALTLAETGHLVFGTLHTRNAPSTVDRIIDVFPTDAQAQIKVLLANTLEGVVSQQFLPMLGGGRCASIEIMIATSAIKNLIREGKTHQMYSSIETAGQIGMQTMDASLAELYRNGRCDWEECLMRAIDKETFARLAKRV